MSIQLKYQEDFSSGLKRLVLEESQLAKESIKNAESEDSRHKAVHETRKAFKKIRACLRLVRDEIDYYKEENRWFRDQGRKLSDIRDSTANIEALQMLKDQYDSEIYKNAFNTLQNRLLTHRGQLADQVFREENHLVSIREDLDDKLGEIPNWDLDIQSFQDIRPSLKRTYKRGLKGLENSLENEKIENLHEWRKRAKYLRYQIDILHRIWPTVFETMEDELHDLTDLTGNLHDLHNLQQLVLEFDEPFSDEEERILFHTLADKQQKYLKRHALLKGQKFYTNSPSEFCDTLEVYWNAHQKEVEDDLLPNREYLEYS